MSVVIEFSPLMRPVNLSVLSYLSCVITDVLHALQNPNVVGSGYIQHPPQRPFAAPLQMQPPTVAVRTSRSHPYMIVMLSGKLQDRLCWITDLSYNTSGEFIVSRKGKVVRTPTGIVSLPETFLLRSTLTFQMSTQSTGHRLGKAGEARCQLEADRISDHRCISHASTLQPVMAF